MAVNHSFTDYVANRFYNELYESINKYIETNPHKLDLHLRKVRSMGGVGLSEIEVRAVSVNDLPGMKIQFDVIIEAEIEVEENNYHYDDSDICSQWFIIRCSGDLGCGLSDFKIMNTDIYIQRNRLSNPLSDSLVPIILKDDLDKVATEFLYKYYPEALKTPMAIEPKKLAERMGLEVKITDITKDFSVFGQIYFHDCESGFYDSDRDEIVNALVKGGTIFVDPKAFFLRNLGAVNNTIVHECVHWDKHRKAFELERLFNSSVVKIGCKVSGGVKDTAREAVEWMEWQANALAPKIQMPIAQFKTKAFEFINLYLGVMGTSDLIDVIEPVIDELAAFFYVSRLAAKIRMIEAGYEEAIGAFTYIDGHYVRPHAFKKGALKTNQTFSIGTVDAAIQSIINPELQSISCKGSYLYVDSHFVLNHTKYITQDENGTTILTGYALHHMDECCLVFNLFIRSGCKEGYYGECFLNRDKTSTFAFDIKFCKGYENSTKENQDKYLDEVLAENARMYDALSNNFLESLDKVRKWRGLTYLELSEMVLMDERQIRRIFKGESNGSLNALILICLAMKLPPEISFFLIEKSPFTLSMGDENHRWYRFVLTYYYGKSLEEIRRFLVDHNVKLL